MFDPPAELRQADGKMASLIFLCGTDSYYARDYSHRKAWIFDRLRHLSGLFGIEVCSYAIMSNHLHLVLRNRPDRVELWSDAEVALRWRKLFPHRNDSVGRAGEAGQAWGNPGRPGSNPGPAGSGSNELGG
jgi:hypothetical protein